MKLSERIEKALSHAGKGVPDTAAMLSVDPSTVYRWTRGESKPYAKYVRALADATGVRYDWLASGEGEMVATNGTSKLNSEVVERPSQEPSARTVRPLTTSGYDADLTILYRGDVRAGASSPGYLVGDEEGDYAERWEFARQLLFDITGVWLKEGDEAMKIAGLSMKRRTSGLDDDQLVFLRPVDEFATGERYVLLVEHADSESFQIFCKRVQVLAGGSLLLISDNRSAGFFDELLKRENGHFVHERTGDRVKVHVKGRVLWPRDEDDDAQIRLITQTIEQLAASGRLPY